MSLFGWFKFKSFDKYILTRFVNYMYQILETNVRCIITLGWPRYIETFGMATPGERDEVVAHSSQQPGMVRAALPSCFSLAAWFRLTVTLSAPLDSSCFFS